ncbi:glycosyltransferase family 4 protein [Rhizobium sp. P44RR-XXIV]|uniref:glycosyltransferase family 4 protein n=1 Tax=Rhizobium sp. P44RR-XXIV TaxID=1921145 RepID=UPI000985BB2B|nr:glycosyltransferase family 4 protein [Rhizobium sp. P44RR-XXIV]TIX87100.1 glycosyltransferase family 4 protein [Rhizobium sp. P44RR-XXIV]
MRILVVSQYFWPESFIINDFARSLVLEGHSVTVVTGKPNYPTGRIWPGYGQAGTSREIFNDNIEVFRVPLRPRGRAGALGLALNYLSFVVSGLLHFPRLVRNRSFDTVLFFGVSPMTAAIPAAFLAWRKKAHLAYWIQDLWPDSLSATGMVTNRLALGMVSLMMRAIYSRADTLLLQSEAFWEPVAISSDVRKLVYFPNPAPLEEFTEEPLPPELEAVFSDCFSIMFAGNLGRAQAVETIVEAARQLRDQPQIRLVVVGTGSEASHMQTMISERGLDNIVLTGLVERRWMPSLFRRAGALLVTLKNEPILGKVVPSKIQAYMQAGKPIIGALNGEGARIIEATGSGLVVAAEDSAGLADSILTLSTMPVSKLEAMGLAGQRYFEANFEARGMARRLIAILETRMGVR